MKKSLFYIFSAGLITVLVSGFTFAQREDRRTVSAASSLYVISAEAGGVNYIEGKVAVERQTGKSGYLLKGDELEIGDKVSTEADGKAEILLNPGSFLRLGENSKFEFLTTSLDDLQLKLTSGSAMFEVITDREFTFAVNTPKSKFYIVKSGIYRVDVSADGASKIEVWKGEAQVSDTNGTEIKSGRQATVNGNQTAIVAKFDRGEKDALEVWSRTRAKELSKINARLDRTRVDRNNLRGSLMNSFYNNGWNLYGSYGVWVFSPFHRSYCFLPFGYGWSSPYGFLYPRDIWQFNLPPVIHNQPSTNQPSTSGNPRDITPVVRNSQPVRKSENPVKFEPPYIRVQREIGQPPIQRSIEPGPSMAPMPLPIPIAPPTPVKRDGN